jgi:hypothetical protein
MPIRNQFLEEFFRKEMLDTTRLVLIQQFKIQYILWGAEQRRLGGWQTAIVSFPHEFANQIGDHLHEYKDSAP